MAKNKHTARAVWDEMTRHPHWTLVKKHMRTGLIIALVALLSAGLLHYILGLTLEISGLSLWLGYGGAILAFTGNNMVTDAVTHYDARSSPLWGVGSPMQTVGFLLTILALILR